MTSGTPFCPQEETRKPLWDKTNSITLSWVIPKAAFCFLRNKRDSYQSPCLPAHQRVCPPGFAPHALKLPSPLPWRPFLSRQTGLLEFSARTRHWCSGWRMKPPPEETDRKGGGKFLGAWISPNGAARGLTSTARVAPEELCRMWKRRALAGFDCPLLDEVPPRWMIMGLPWKRLIRCGGSCPWGTRTW